MRTREILAAIKRILKDNDAELQAEGGMLRLAKNTKEGGIIYQYLGNRIGKRKDK